VKFLPYGETRVRRQRGGIPIFAKRRTDFPKSEKEKSDFSYLMLA
jgi:hypothetical protein